MDVSTIMWMVTLIFSFSPLIHCQTGEIFFISQTGALYYMIRDTSFIFTQPNPTVSYEAAALNPYNIIDTTHGNSRKLTQQTNKRNSSYPRLSCTIYIYVREYPRTHTSLSYIECLSVGSKQSGECYMIYVLMLIYLRKLNISYWCCTTDHFLISNI